MIVIECSAGRNGEREMSEKYFVGVDVGTGSVRAALVTQTGKVLKVHVKATKTWNPLPDHYEQSSDNIWHGVCECVQVNNRKLISCYSFTRISLFVPLTVFFCRSISCRP